MCFDESGREGFLGHGDGEFLEGSVVPVNGGECVNGDFYPGLFVYGEAGEEVVGY